MKRFYALAAALAALLSACHFNSGNDQALGGNMQQSRFVPPGSQMPQPHRLEKFVNDQVELSYESTLVAHSKFVFLEECEPGMSFNRHDNMAKKYGDSTSSTEVYPIDKNEEIRFDQVDGHTILVNFPDHTQQRVKIKDVVIVREGIDNAPYYAGVIDLPEDKTGQGVWATTKSRLNPFPFVEVQDEQISATALVYLDSLAELFHFCHTLNSDPSFDGIEQPAKVRIFEARKGEKYVFIQHCWRNNSGEFIESYSAMYHVTPSGWALEVEGELDLELTDFIDTDGDFYPELLMSHRSGTVIYEINFEGFDAKESLWWSPYREMPESVCSG